MRTLRVFGAEDLPDDATSQNTDYKGVVWAYLMDTSNCWYVWLGWRATKYYHFLFHEGSGGDVLKVVMNA